MDKKAVQKNIDEIFKEYHKKENDYLTIEELKLFMEDIFEDSNDEDIENELKKLMKEMDLNRDGKISKKEMKKYFIK